MGAQYHYSHPLAYTRYLISRSTGETFDFIVPPVKNVVLTLKDFSAGRYRIRWIDTVTGAVISEEIVVVNQGRLQLTVPLLQQDLAAVATIVT